MRKIDAVLLSALIVYDYSAQSLVDSDRISLGHSFINNGFHDNKLTNPEYDFTPVFTDEQATVVRGVKHLNATATNTTSKNISYYELAKMTAATTEHSSAVATESNTENTTAAENTVSASMEAVENVSFDKEAVDLNEEAYTNTEALANATIEEHVSDVADMATFDGDNDGTYDVEDKCPGVAGVARFEGCPVPDSDADGINDEEDRCPLEVGNGDNFGCPVISSDALATTEATATENNNNGFAITFAGDSKALSNDDFNIVLQITDILVRDANAKIEVEGNTNDTGSAKAPTERVYNYFKDLGVNSNQITIKGISQEKNLQSGNTVAIRIVQ